jgi:hypothetical protein
MRMDCNWIGVCLDIDPAAFELNEGEIMTEKDKLILEIMTLAYAVDQNTEYCVFMDFYGHVGNGQLMIKITESIANYHNEIASTEFYLNGKYQKDDGLDWLRCKRDHLKHILDEHEIDAGGMVEHSRCFVEYAF